LHDQATTPDATDWPQIAGLYAALEQRSPSPVVALNHAVAVAMAEGPQIGLERIEAIAAEGTLDAYAYLHAARADLLRRLGRYTEARVAYERALGLTANAPERRFLRRRLTEVGDPA
ncbi:MAG: RNA polymerase subunit sigma-24, partial [Chloroflexota bacterium]